MEWQQRLHHPTLVSANVGFRILGLGSEVLSDPQGSKFLAMKYLGIRIMVVSVIFSLGTDSGSSIW